MTPPAPVPPPNESTSGEVMLCGASNGEDENGYLIVCVLREYHVGLHEWSSSAFDPADVDALAEVLWDACETGDPYCMGNPYQAARDLLASDWLADIVAAAKAEERERVAAAIEGMSYETGLMTTGAALARAAAIARSAPSTTEPGDER